MAATTARNRMVSLTLAAVTTAVRGSPPSRARWGLAPGLPGSMGVAPTWSPALGRHAHVSTAARDQSSWPRSRYRGRGGTGGKGSTIAHSSSGTRSSARVVSRGTRTWCPEGVAGQLGHASVRVTLRLWAACWQMGPPPPRE
jgi:hypothetical protein